MKYQPQDTKKVILKTGGPWLELQIHSFEDRRESSKRAASRLMRAVFHTRTHHVSSLDRLLYPTVSSDATTACRVLLVTLRKLHPPDIPCTRQGHLLPWQSVQDSQTTLHRFYPPDGFCTGQCHLLPWWSAQFCKSHCTKLSPRLCTWQCRVSCHDIQQSFNSYTTHKFHPPDRLCIWWCRPLPWQSAVSQRHLHCTPSQGLWLRLSCLQCKMAEKVKTSAHPSI